jgi:hypothetical protein
VGGGGYFETDSWEWRLHEDSNDDCVRVLNFATSKSTMLTHRNIHKYTRTYPDWKIHSQVDYVLIDKGWHSSILHEQSSRGADCDNDHYLASSEVRERLSVGKQEEQMDDLETFNFKRVSEL